MPYFSLLSSLPLFAVAPLGLPLLPALELQYVLLLLGCRCCRPSSCRAGHFVVFIGLFVSALGRLLYCVLTHRLERWTDVSFYLLTPFPRRDTSSDPSMAVGAVGRPPGAPTGPPGSARWLPGTAQVCFSSYRPKFGARPFVLRCLRAEAARPCIMRMAHSHPENHEVAFSDPVARLALESLG